MSLSEIAEEVLAGAREGARLVRITPLAVMEGVMEDVIYTAASCKHGHHHAYLTMNLSAFAMEYYTATFDIIANPPGTVYRLMAYQEVLSVGGPHTVALNILWFKDPGKSRMIGVCLGKDIDELFRRRVLWEARGLTVPSGLKKYITPPGIGAVVLRAVWRLKGTRWPLDFHAPYISHVLCFSAHKHPDLIYDKTFVFYLVPAIATSVQLGA